MNKTEFISYIAHPQHAAGLSLFETEKVINQFPYWQSARLIYVKALHEKQHFSYQAQLKLAAIYAGDRKILFELINKKDDLNTAATTETLINDKIITDIEVSDITTEQEHLAVEKSIDSDTVTEEKQDTYYYTEQIIIPLVENTAVESENYTKIIEQRILELSQSNSNDENIIEVMPDEIITQSATDIADETTSKITGDVPAIYDEEVLSIKEELAAFDEYEETAIAKDVFNNTFTHEPETATGQAEEAILKEHENASQHSFVEWFKFLKNPSIEDVKNADPTIAIVNNAEQKAAPDTDTIISSTTDTIDTTIPIIKPDSIRLQTLNIEKQLLSLETEKADFKPETELINKFIKEDPRLSPKKSSFFSPSVAARKSVIYDEEVVSETLAEIFYNQQLYDKALIAYEKLSLMFPEKSTLFAARIKKIHEEGKSGK